MDFAEFFKRLPKNPERHYETKRDTPGLVYKFEAMPKVWVTVYVTGTNSPELPTEVAAALGAWSLSLLAERVTK